MFFVNLTVDETETTSDWLDIGQAVQDTLAGGADYNTTSLLRRQSSLARFQFDADYNQANATLEFADDAQGTNASALCDTDGSVLSTLTMPTGETLVRLPPSDYCHQRFVRVKLPGAASQAFTFRVGVRIAE